MRRVASKSPIRFPASLSIRASRAIQKLGRQWRVNPAEVTQFETLPGQGLRANIGGRIFLLGNGQLAGIAPRSSPSTNSLGLEVWVAGEDLLCRMGFRDALRPEAERILRNLAEMGLRTVMLTGDRAEVAEQIARGVQIGEIRAGLMPEQKVAAIRRSRKMAPVRWPGWGRRERCAMPGGGRCRRGHGCPRRGCGPRAGRSGPHERPPREFSARPGAEPSLAPDHLSEHRHSSGNGCRDDVRCVSFSDSPGHRRCLSTRAAPFSSS